MEMTESKESNFEISNTAPINPSPPILPQPMYDLKCSSLILIILGNPTDDFLCMYSWKCSSLIFIIVGYTMDSFSLYICNSSPWVFDTGSVAMISNSKQELQNEQRLVESKVTMCVGSDSKVDKITIAHSLYLRD